MSRFPVHSHPENQRLRALYPWSVMIFIALVLGSVVYLWGKWESLVFLLLGFGGTLWSVTQTIRKKAAAHFVEITPEKIEWLLSEENAEMITVPLSSLRWIKQENGGNILLARKRKESAIVDLHQFPDDVREQIVFEIKQAAAQKQVDIINL